MQALAGIIVGIIIVGGGAWYFTSGSSDTAPTTGEETVMEESTDAPEGAGTFAELMARTGSWTCDASAQHEGGGSSGTVVMNNGKLRGDFTSTMSGITVSSSFIGRDGYMYTWTSMLPQGFKVAIDASTGTSGGQGIDPSTQVEYSCAPWSADESKFELPSGITFMEMNAQGSAGFPMPN